MQRPSQMPPSVPGFGASRLLMTVFGVVFCGVGVTVLGFMWLTPSDAFDAPPMFFRIFASFIAIPFVAMGGTMAYSAIRGGGLLAADSLIAEAQQRAQTLGANQPMDQSTVGYVCPSCGAALGEKADVSPMGDVKCGFCGRWFNVHKSG